MKTYGFAIIGCGMISNFHAKAIESLPNARLVACFDVYKPSAERLAENTGCKAYDNLDEMLADPEIDIVTIGTPSGAHLDPALAAAHAGKHVIVEKPLEITLERCDQIIQACRENNVKLATVFHSRFHDASVMMKNAIDSGRFGKLTVGDTYVKWFRSQQYYDSGAWRGTWALDGGGALMNQAIHSVDLLTWLMGPVVEIRSMFDCLDHERIEVEDTAAAVLRFENGAIGVIEASTAIYPGYLKKVEIHGSKGSATIEEEDIVRWDFAEEQVEDAQIKEEMLSSKSSGGGAADPSAISFKGHAKLFADMIHAVETDTEPKVNGPEGRRSVEIILGIYKSAETGQPVKLPMACDPELECKKNKTVKK
ncbi:MAG: Gfo/Idh/MocA family oxidoreductase [Planctomycetia bacterium]|nr:Gfo/Idh/MocA family oxidoreductase [Planctomycetia bacterium]